MKVKERQGEGGWKTATSRVGYRDPGGIPDFTYSRLALTDLGRSIPTIGSHHFRARARALDPFGLVYTQRLHDSSTTTSNDDCRPPLSPIAAEDARHQSYKADRLSRQTTLPLCRATTNVPRFRPAFVKERGATLFGDTYRGVICFFPSERTDRRAMFGAPFWRK